MVQEYEKMIDTWPVFAALPSPPENDEALDRLIEFSEYLLYRIGDNEDHPLTELPVNVSNLIEDYESERFPEPASDPVGSLKYMMEETDKSTAPVQLSGIIINGVGSPIGKNRTPSR